MHAVLDLDEYLEDRTPWHLWAIGLMTLAWGGFRLSRFLMVQTGFADVAAKRTAEMVVFADLPAWGTAFWAMWVLGALVGSALLLLRSRHALDAYRVAVAGLAGTSLCLFALKVSPVGIYDMPITFSTWIITVAAFLYVRRIAQAEWLR